MMMEVEARQGEKDSHWPIPSAAQPAIFFLHPTTRIGIFILLEPV
jgi:hypothetical protein